MNFNLLSYPIIAKWKSIAYQVNLKDYDFVSIYNLSLPFTLKSWVYNAHDFN